MTQAFQDLSAQQFADLPVFPGTSWVVLAEPMPQANISAASAILAGLRLDV